MASQIRTAALSKCCQDSIAPRMRHADTSGGRFTAALIDFISFKVIQIHTIQYNFFDSSFLDSKKRL